MFDIGWSELLVIGVVALIVIGPKELPSVLRTVGQWVTRIRRMATEFQGQFQEAMREAELADMRKQFEDVSQTAQTYSSFDPIGTIRKEFESSVDKIGEPAEPATSAATPAECMTTPAEVPPATPPETTAALPEPEINVPAPDPFTPPTEREIAADDKPGARDPVEARTP